MNPTKLVKIFKALKKELKNYSPPLKPKYDLKSKYDLWSFKDLEIMGRKRKEVYFAGLIIQSNYVGFYYMPVYVKKDLKKVIGPNLLKTLKGLSCFHIKTMEGRILGEIRKALKIGFGLYKERGWV